ncbi:hypothetical protein COU91_00395 [Candidatus Saccharibacteria bacterium CG10_big_fil_rev_8_21_14_0_10_47_8]|nr:MAG: hypothetical protein COU91_00395 [Candidatus Saccharibacteria bacterium CG10_big_fil_rev_8_21_14_0_10_47_8]
MRSNNIHTSKSRGDTIVEVLISVTIISFVLGAAYLLTSHSLQAGLAAREHTEALNFVQGQIERLKAVKEQASKAEFDSKYRTIDGSTPYCLFADPITRVVSQKLTTDVNKFCEVDSEHPNGGEGSRYHLSTKYINGGANANTFKFSATWDRVGTGTPESADIYYRPSNSLASIPGPGPGPSCTPTTVNISLSEPNPLFYGGPTIHNLTLVPVLTACSGPYTFTVTTHDTGHPERPGVDQLNEGVFLEGYNSDGTLVFHTDVTPDIPHLAKFITYSFNNVSLSKDVNTLSLKHCSIYTYDPIIANLCSSGIRSRANSVESTDITISN